MSTLFSPDSKFLQRFLSSGGYYNDDIDGDVGPNTLEAVGKFEADTEQVANELGSFDKRTEKSIRTMLIPTQRKAREFMKEMRPGWVKSGSYCPNSIRHTHVRRTERTLRARENEPGGGRDERTSRLYQSQFRDCLGCWNF